MNNVPHSLTRSQDMRSHQVYRPLSRCDTLKEKSDLTIEPVLANRSLAAMDQVDGKIQQKYDNVPTLQEIVRSVEMTNIYDRYVNISSTIISTRKQARSQLNSTFDARAIEPSPVQYTDKRGPWRVFSQTADPVILYQNIHRRENDMLLTNRNDDLWDHNAAACSRDDYGFLPEHHSTLTTSWNYRLTHSNI
ncbi:hypothetical protein GJ496_011820 [Pomphorhynchus laevis]|nr:hypothetical protein GJ496_011820 [Pomphorhynchus laevis]